jgi:hypothetical protein
VWNFLHVSIQRDFRSFLDTLNIRTSIDKKTKKKQSLNSSLIPTIINSFWAPMKIQGGTQALGLCLDPNSNLGPNLGVQNLHNTKGAHNINKKYE